jgi:very-short-patch-repair endonuclease
MRKATTSKKRGQPKPDPYDMFVFLCRSYLKEECVRELRFHPVRRWRFDYAIPSHKIAIEVEGGVWTQGRHTRPKGFLGDMEKYNTATALGWRILRVTPETLTTGATLDLIKQTIRTTQQTSE